MKYLILLGVVFAVIWWIKLSRPATPADKTSTATDGPQNMVRCAHCGLHLPDNEAVLSRNTAYCSEAHRVLAES
ncbi:MAG: hypothetical protein EXR37_00220 [Limnohabitans sp.]|nr:hypothetical protein [Limnohabitans sp.]